MEDEEIIELFFRRDETAIVRLGEKYGARCRRIARDVTGNAEDGEECVSDAYLALWRAIPPLRPLHLGAYLVSAVRNAALSRVRARGAARRGGGEYALALDELENAVASPDTPERAVERAELAAAIEGFLPALCRDDRIIFMRRYWLFSPVADIARDLGTTAARVKSSLYRSRKKLREHLEKEGLI